MDCILRTCQVIFANLVFIDSSDVSSDGDEINIAKKIVKSLSDPDDKRYFYAKKILLHGKGGYSNLKRSVLQNQYVVVVESEGDAYSLGKEPIGSYDFKRSDSAIYVF